MGNLKGNQVYLVGPIDRAPDSGAGWRNQIKPLLIERFGLKVFDPLNKPLKSFVEGDLNTKLRHEWKNKKKYKKLSHTMKAIRATDLRCCDLSHFIIAYLDIDIYSCGTFEEIFLANRQKKPVLIWCKQGKKAIPDWLFGTLPHQMMFGSMKKLIKYLDKIDTSKEERIMNRWLLFGDNKQ